MLPMKSSLIARLTLDGPDVVVRVGVDEDRLRLRCGEKFVEVGVIKLGIEMKFRRVAIEDGFVGFGDTELRAHVIAAAMTARPPLGQSVAIQNAPMPAIVTAVRKNVIATRYTLVLTTYFVGDRSRTWLWSASDAYVCV